VGSHYDSVETSPGGNDNASGTVTTLAIAEALAHAPLAEHLWFVAFDGEEQGLYGSDAFVEKLDGAIRQHLEGMVNFDMVGINKELWVSGSDKFVSLALLLDGVTDTFEDEGNSDHASFEGADIPVLYFTRGLHKDYHSPGDNHIDLSALNETICVGIEAIAQILPTVQ
jgi:hypothetical protein